jgi:hypothetical protein
VPALWRAEGVVSVGAAVEVHGAPSRDFGVVGDQPEERSQRHGRAARVGVEELQDGS